jgi:hypothetical protein
MKTLIVAGTALLLGATSAAASSPDTSTVTVPAAGPKQVSTTWGGSVPLGLTTTFSDCSGNAASTYDSHKIHVNVAKGAYNVVKARLEYVVDIHDTLQYAFDFIELKDPSGGTVGIAQQTQEMSIEILNPVPGDYTALVCSFMPTMPATYTASATVVTKCKGVSPCPTPPKKRR